MVISILALFAAMISIQFGASLAKQLFPIIGAPGTTALRLLFAAILLCLVWRPWTHSVTRQTCRTPWRMPFRMLVAYGAVLGAMNLLFYLAIARIPLGVAVALEFTGPLALAILLSRKPLDFLWAGLAIVGIFFVFPPSQSNATLDMMGVLYALGAGVCWGLYIVFGQRAGALMPSGTTAAFGMVVASLVAVPIATVLTPTNMLAQLTLPVLGIGLVVAVLSSAIPYTLEMIALKRMPAKTFSIFMSIEPALAAISGLLLLHEQLLGTQWGAIACIMTASLGSALSGRREPEK